MSKFQSTKNPNTPSPTYPVPAKEFSPEWFEANREKIQEAGYQFVSKEELHKKIHVESEAEKAAKELLGLDVDAPPPAKTGDAQSLELWEFLTKLRIQLDLILSSTQFRSLMSPKEREVVYNARVLLRQIFNETPPPGQAGCLRDQIGAHAQTSDGVLGIRVAAPGPPRKKPVKIDHRHLQQAGVIE